MEKPKTVKDMKRYCYHDQARKLKTGMRVKKLMSGNMIRVVDYNELKKEAIKAFLYGVKKRKNPFNMFLDFHDITEEDFKE